MSVPETSSPRCCRQRVGAPKAEDMNRKHNGPPGARPRPFRIAVVMTGGTIAKTYDRRRAILRNSEPIVVRLVKALRMEGARITFHDLMHKDSQDVDQADR